MSNSEKMNFDKYYYKCIVPSLMPKVICYSLYALLILILGQMNKCFFLLYILLTIYILLQTKQILSKYLLSAKTYEELKLDQRDALVNEYYIYVNDSKVLHEFGAVTQYALICDEGMASWQNITEIAFRSKKINWIETLVIGISRDPCYMSVKACFNNKKYSWRVVLPGSYDLAPKIEQFVGEALSHNNRIFIDNEYHYD